LCGALGIATPIAQSSDYEIAEGRTERLVSLCRQAGAARDLSGPGPRGHLGETRLPPAGHARGVGDDPGLRGIPPPPPPVPPAVRAGAERRGRAAEPRHEGAAAPAGPREDRAWLTGATRSRARRATTDRRRAPTARRPRAWTGIRRNRSSGGSISSAGSSTPPGRSRSTTTAAATARWWTGSLRAAGRSRVTGFAPRPSTS